jgi:isoleucyl-tRNA synthetase
VDLSALYLDILKDRLYTYRLDHPERRSGQTVIFHILKNLNGLIAPILSFLAEEVYLHRKDKIENGSIFLEPFPTEVPEWDNSKIEQDVQFLFELRDVVQKQLEDMRAQKIIGSSLEAQVKISAPIDKLEILKQWTQLREILIVSCLSLEEGEWKVSTLKAEGEKCPRCWVYSTKIDPISGVCPKCLEALQSADRNIG